MDSLLNDFRFALRSLWRTPAFTVAAVLTLALGIGANTAIFSVVDGVLLRPAPFAGVDRLVMVWETDRNAGTTREPSSLPDFVDFQQRSKTLTHLSAFSTGTLTLTRDNGDAERLTIMAITPDFVAMLGVTPVAGRLLEKAETEPGGPRSVLVSEGFATRTFETSENAIGKTIRVNDVDWQVVGVLPHTSDFGTRQILAGAAYGRGFADRSERTRIDAWFGLRANPTAYPRDTHPFFVMARLAPGATVDQAHKELTGITAELERAYPSNAQRGAFVEPLSAVVFGNVRPALYTLLAAVGLVLLVACANVANLLLMRAAARTREVSVRLALGAGLRRLAQQFIVEGFVLAGAGAALGVLIAFTALDALAGMAPANVPRVESITIDARVLVVSLGVTVLVALIFGLLPTLQARRHQLQASMRSGGRGGTAGREQRGFRSALVVAELAMASALMVGAGLLVKSLWRLQHVDAGFASEGVLKAEYQLPASRYPRDFATFPRWPEQHRFNDDLRARVAGLPGVEAVALASSHPLDAGYTSSIVVIGREAEAANWPEPSIRQVAYSYFETMHVPLRAGRAFAATDNADAPPVAMVNEAGAKRYFGARDPIGQRIRLWGAARTIIGIAGNERFHGLTKDTPPGVYLPLSQAPTQGTHALLVRVRGEPAAFAAAIRSTIRDIDARLPVYGVEPLPETIAQSIGQQRFTMLVLGAFAFVALLLAAVGVHGVLSYAVSQRTSEIGIRMALGADARSVRTLVLGEGATLMAAGLVIGLVGAVALTQLLSALLFGVSPRDPLTFVVVAAALGGVAMFATYLPARRAARVDPMEALRAE